MYYKAQFFFILLLLLSLSVRAQDTQGHLFCGHDIGLHSMETRYPGYRDAVARTFADAKMRVSDRSRSRDTYVVRVVFHVVWLNEEENLPDSVLISQLNVLNEDFQRLNEDRHDLRDIFRDRQADAGIRFELAEVKRIYTDKLFTPQFIALPDEVKQSGQGGSDAADPSAYLNIWICKLQTIPFFGGQLFGYAYPPAGLPNWPEGVSAPSPGLDGVVVDYRCVGRNNPYPMDVQGLGVIFQNGRTLTHEIGHYLGLRHIWGDGGGIFGGNDCTVDDGVDDTPNQGSQTNYSCDKTRNTCIDSGETDEPDMIENYMDYSTQECLNTFTQGQVAIMRSVLENERRGLLWNQTSVAKAEFGSELILAPNPVDDRLLIRSVAAMEGEYRLMDQNGRILSGNRFSVPAAGSLEVQTASLVPGLYFIQVTNARQSATLRFLKQ